MPKRIILFILGLVIAIGAFWLYQTLTGTTFFTPKAVLRPTTRSSEIPPGYESRYPDGQLEYVVNARKIELVKNANNESTQGQYELTEPTAVYYTTDNQIIKARADRGVFIVDNIGSGTKIKPVPRGGRLAGNIIITIGPAASFIDGSFDLQPGQIQIRLDKDLEFDYNDRLFTSAGNVQVRNERVEFDGKRLTLALNMVDRRIEFLRIDEGNKILLKNIANDALALRPTVTTQESPATNSATTDTAPALVTADPATPSDAPAATHPAATKAATPPTTYKLSFGSQVKASVGTRSHTSEQLFVLFMIDGSNLRTTKKTVTSAPAPHPTFSPAPAKSPATAPTTQLVLAPVPPLSKEQESDLVVTWSGPMEMRPSGPDDLKLLHGRDAALEAVGTRENPVIMRDTTGNSLRQATAGRIWYHAAAQKLQLEKGDLAAITFADPTLGKATCDGLAFTQTGDGTSTVELVGPGNIEVLQSAVRRSTNPQDAKRPPITAAWSKLLVLDLLTIPDSQKSSTPANSPASSPRGTLMVRHGVMTGDVALRDTGFSLRADSLDFLIASTADSKNPAALEKLLATGHIQIRAARTGSTSLLDADKPDGLSANTLELLTAVAEGSKLPVLSSMIASGDVLAWSHTEDKDTKKIHRQQITAPKLQVDLAPRDASAAVATTQSFDGSQVQQMIASDGVKVELEGFGALPVTATAQSLVADPKAGKATLQGIVQPNGIVRFARVQQGENQIAGEKILLDQKSQSLEIPGNGAFVFSQPGQKAGDADTPVQVTWSKNMSYHGKGLLASFNGNVKAEMLGHADQYSRLTCDESLTVKLTQQNETNAAGPATAPTATAPASLGKIQLAELIALGNVKAEGATLDPAQKPITRLFMQAPKLVYTEASKTMTIPGTGSLLIEDYRIDPQTRPEGKGQTAFAWTGSLSYVGTTGTITFSKDVRMIHIPVKPFQPAGAKPADKPAAQRIDLNCSTLTALMIQSKDAGGGNTIASPVALGAGGNQKLAKVSATDAALNLDNNELAAAILDFDAVENKAVARGKNGSWAAFSNGDNRGEADQIIWDLTKDGQNAFTLIRPRGNITTPN